MSPVKEELSGGFGGFYANIQQQCKYFFIKFISNLEDALYSNSYTLSFPYQEKKTSQVRYTSPTTVSINHLWLGIFRFQKFRRKKISAYLCISRYKRIEESIILFFASCHSILKFTLSMDIKQNSRRYGQETQERSSVMTIKTTLGWLVIITKKQNSACAWLLSDNKGLNSINHYFKTTHT